MKAFAERNLIATAAVGIVALTVVCVGAYYADSLPLLSGGTHYAANFGDAANLQTGDDVRVAGVKVGSVDSIELDGAKVKIGFEVKDAWIGNRSTVAINIKTTLGQEYLAIDPQGTRTQNPHDAIPLTRTTTPFDVTQALGDLASTAGAINTDRLADSFTTLSDAFANTPPAVRSALTGLTRLSKTISDQDDRIVALSTQTAKLTSTLATSNTKFASLINDGAALLQSVNARSGAISQLLTGTRDLSEQLSGLVADNTKLLGPALAQLGKVTTILANNKANLTKALHVIGPYYTLLNNAVGSGPWIDIYLCGLFTKTDTPVLNPTAQRNCHPRAGS